jgi:SAM-dependent methyltransferase
MESDKERHARVWGSAPFERAAATIADMHDALVAALEPQPRERWLDLACGAGDVALRAAAAGAVVTGSDLAPALIETAKRRAAEAELELTFEVADCEELPYDDESFDIVSSSIGVMFAPDHAAVVSELARVTRPGGRLGLTSWLTEDEGDDSFEQWMGGTVGSPAQWGVATYVRRRLEPWFDLRIDELSTPHVGEDAAAMWRNLRDSHGPIHEAWLGLDDAGRAAMDAEEIADLELYRGEDGVIRKPRGYLLTHGVRR